MYFSKFPQTYYTFDGKNAVLLTNFLARVSLSSELKNNPMLYDTYTIVDGDTPEIVADKVYKNPFLHWIILLTNEIINPRYDWCMSQENLLMYCEDKYDNPYGIHHYENESGLVVDADYPGAYPVSNYEYEDKLNESRRVIKILNPALVKDFIQQFEDAMVS